MDGYKVNGVQEQRSLNTQGQIEEMSVISITTDRGNTGTVKLTTQQYEGMDDNDLMDLLTRKAALLDRAQMLQEG